MILFILNEFRFKSYQEMWGNERDWDRVEIVSLAHTPTSLYLTPCLRKVFFPKQQKPTQKPTPAWEIGISYIWGLDSIYLSKSESRIFEYA